MRKIVFWCGAGVVAAVSVGALTAAYTCRHPESPASRFIVACNDLDAAYNPIHRIGAAATREIAGAVRPTTGAGEPGHCCGASSDTCVPPADPKPLDVAVVPGDVEVRPECRVPGRINIEEEAQRSALTVLAGAEESEEPLVTPPVVEERTVRNQTMPYADEEPATREKSFFSSLWEKLTAWRPTAQPTSGGEECEEKVATSRHGAMLEKQKQADTPVVPRAGDRGVERPFDEVKPEEDSGTTEFRPSDAKKYGVGRPMPF